MKKRLKIGMFTDTYFPQTNGVVTSIHHFKKQLEKLGHEVYIITAKVPKYKDKEKNVIRYGSAKAFFHPELRFPTFIGPRAIRQILKLKLDVVHSHSPLSLGFFAEFISAITKAPHIHTYHTIYPEYAHYASENKFVMEIISKYVTEKGYFLFLNRCDSVLVHSKKIEKYLTGNIRPPIHRTHLGMPIPKKFDKEAMKKIQKQYKLKESDKILMWAGRMGKEKNVELAYQVAKRLAKKDEDYKMLFVGDGPLNVEYRAMAKKDGLQKNILFTGYVPHENIYEYFRLADIFVFPSHSETFGLVVLEALATGTPAIVAKDDAYAETVFENKTGFQIKKDNAADYAKKIELLMKDNQLYQRMAHNGKEVADSFSIQRATEQLLKYYHSVLKEHHRE